jgi:hypothetical protein
MREIQRSIDNNEGRNLGRVHSERMINKPKDMNVSGTKVLLMHP